MKAKYDRTYCYGINCNKKEQCGRYVKKYEFDDSGLYSFTAGNFSFIQDNIYCKDFIYDKDK